MRRLTRAHGDERGAVLVVVALISTVLLAMSALVVDVASLLDERRQLQNAADAGALGLAEECARLERAGGSCPSVASSALGGIAEHLADENSLDGNSSVELPIVIDLANKQVTVRTTTRTGDSSILPYWFGPAVTGEAGKTVRASATASWAGLARARVIPLTLGVAEFDCATQAGDVYGNPTVIYFLSTETNCGVPRRPGLDRPGGFGWVDDGDGDCDVTLAAGDTVEGDEGVPGAPHGCDLSTLVAQDVLVPIHDSATGGGGGGGGGSSPSTGRTYHVYGFGMFHLTGYRMPTQSPNTAGEPVPCRSGSTCIGGHFIKFVPVGDLGGPSDLGSRASLVS